MTYDQLDDMLGYEIVCRYTYNTDDGDQYRFLLFRLPNGNYSVLEYQTLGFPAPNDPDNTDRWLRNHREQVEAGDVDKAQIVRELRDDYYRDVWGGPGIDFANFALEKLGA